MGALTYAMSTTTGSVTGAVDATAFILAFLFGLQLTWRATGAIKWDKYVVDTTGRDIRALRLLLALLGGLIAGLVMTAFAICVSLLSILV